MVGFVANRRGARLPCVVPIALLLLLALLSYNYWSVWSAHARLQDELSEAHAQVKRTDAARSRLEKRSSELMQQADAHRRQIEQKEADYSALHGKLQARDVLLSKCTDEKMKLQNDVTAQMSEIHRMKEQVKELKQEIIRQEDQLREVKKNSTNLERKLEYESLQCGRQIAQLKDEYEESKKAMEEEAAKLRKSVLDTRKTGAVAVQAEGGTEVEAAGERHTEATRHHDNPDMKEEMVKPGSDAGMPGIEDGEVGKLDDVHFALKKPAITQKHMEPAEAAIMIKEERAGALAGDNAVHSLPLDRPDIPQEAGAGQGMGNHVAQIQQQVPQPVVDKPVLFDEDNKAAVQADEFGEQRRQLRGPDNQQGQGALPPPPNPAQVLPNPIEPQLSRDLVPAAALRHRQNPQHGSKLADYNGDDGNVGEYEADKQAELAYNEEEDGDGGEEDAQDDEDREVPGDHGVDYGKRHQGNEIL
ncbi:protein GOLM2-like isoform X2 [Hoplias malabaricus]|uniref:protein GOLM2-like isoform X2 n=1 Tax=Hoplias malabaricus TaxID=27720 RepID=UPI0034637497